MTDPEERVAREIEEQADQEPLDPTTAREGLETELMDEDASEAGRDIGEHLE